MNHKKNLKMAFFFARECVPSSNFFKIYFNSILECNESVQVIICHRYSKVISDNITKISNPTISHKEFEDGSQMIVPDYLHNSMDIGDICIVLNSKDCYNIANIDGRNDMVICAESPSVFYSTYYKNNKLDCETAFKKLEFDNRNSMNPVISQLISYDCRKDCIYEYNHSDCFVSHGYIRGLGFLIHTDLDSIRNAISYVCHVSRDGMNLWENWYGHPLDGSTYRDIDCDSGFMRICPIK